MMKVKDWLQSKSQSILTTSAFALMAGLSFIGGTLFQKDHASQATPLVINVPDYEAMKQDVLKQEQGVIPVAGESNLDPVAKVVQESAPKEESQSNCPYVGSKNSDKYHKASCGIVKRIKLENRRCFATPQIAEASGYVAGCIQ
jgi:hypothetical protein